MSRKIKEEYTALLGECERAQTSKMWKAYQQYVLQLQAEADLDREDTVLLAQALSKLGLYKQAFDVMDNVEDRNQKENKIWYELKVNSETSGDNPKIFKYLTSKKFDLDRLLSKPFRDEITRKSQEEQRK